MSGPAKDRWLLPSRQYELPGRDLVSPTVLHGRREATFLVLATMFVVATIALPLFAASTTVVDLGALLSLERPLELGLGVIAFPLALVTGQLVCELFGARRSDALALIGGVASLALVVLALASGGDLPLVLALGLVVYTVVAHATNALVFASARRSLRGHYIWLRSLLAISIAQIIGWAAFLAAMAAAGEDLDAWATFAAGGAMYACACAFAAMIPLSLARRVLALYLRVGRTDEDALDHVALAPAHATAPAPAPRPRLPPAVIVDEEPQVLRGPEARFERPAPPLQFSTGEMEFFAEGEALAEAEQT